MYEDNGFAVGWGWGIHREGAGNIVWYILTVVTGGFMYLIPCIMEVLMEG